MSTPEKYHRGCAGFVVLLALITSVVPIVTAILLRDAEWNQILAAIWPVVTGWGVVATCWTWHDSWLERCASNPDDRALRLIANANVRREAVRTFVLLALFYIGLTVFADSTNVTVNRVLFIAIALGLVINSLFDRVERVATAHVLRATLELERSRTALDEALAERLGEGIT